MPTDLPVSLQHFLEKPNPAVMATTTKDGRPVTVATWYQLEPDGRILVNLDAERVRLRHLRRDPRFALDVLDAGNWYTHVALRLDVVEIMDDTHMSDIDALSEHYVGAPYDNRTRPRVSVRASITDWMGWNTSPED
ncbi:MAG: TIGR03618 family F420-dependent PPOX class oxidoreductase [Mycetocola sp.]